MNKLSLIVIILTTIFAVSSFAAVIHIPGDFPTIQAGIDSTVNGDTVLVAGGIWTGTGNRSLDFSGRNIVVKSETGPYLCILDCQYNSRGINFHSGESREAVFAGFTILHGRPVADGGAVRIQDSSPTIRNCYFLSGSATGSSSGGGIFIGAGSRPLIDRCLISGNYADYRGGGICVNPGAEPIIRNCSIVSNTCQRGGGVYLSDSLRVEIVNCIIEGNQSGIYISGRAQAGINYCDFNNNMFGNITGTPPPNFGRIVTVNNNGDSCDIYHNLLFNPQFHATAGDSAYFLRPNSPCIDAGDPVSPRDPDHTIADIGALYYHHETVQLSITLLYPPLIIPPGGGYIHFILDIHYNYGSPLSNLDIWSEAVLPNGHHIGPFMRRSGINLAQGASITRQTQQVVPRSAPSGWMTYFVYIGVYPDSILGDDSVEFYKLTGEDAYHLDSEREFSGWHENSPQPTRGGNPSEPVSFNVHPNPFNEKTVASFELRAANQVRLAVYDISGREAAVLAEEWYPAGHHSMLFDASNLPSGVYFARLTAGDLTQTRKLLLVK